MGRVRCVFVFKVRLFCLFLFLFCCHLVVVTVNTYEGAMFAYLQEWEVPPLCQIHPDMLVRDFTGWQLQPAMLLHYRGNCDFNDVSQTFSCIFFFSTYRRSPTRSTAFTQYNWASELFAFIDCYVVDFFVWKIFV